MKFLSKDWCYMLGCFLFLCLLAFVFQWLPLRDLLIEGPYTWGISTPQFFQGGIEILLIFVLFLVFSLFLRNKILLGFLIIIFSFLYLRLHQVLIPALVALLYFEVIIAVGRFFYSLFFGINEKQITLLDYVKWFFLGFIVWSFFALVFSFFGLGGFVELRLLTLILGIISLLKGFKKPMIFLIFQRFCDLDRPDKVLSVCFLIVFLVLFAKSNIALNFDSLWYGLSPEYLFIGPNSFFDNLGLTFTVHYYPKLFELFLVPVSNLGDYSFIYSGNILFLLLFLVIVYNFFLSFGLKNRESLLGTALVMSIPALSNYAATAKPDFLNIFLVIFGIFYFWNWFKKGGKENFFLALSAIVLSFCVKYLSFAYVPFVLIGFLLEFFVISRYSKLKVLFDFKNFKRDFFWVLVVVLSLFVLFGISYRTYILTGHPFLMFPGLWDYLGFDFNYPFAAFNSDSARFFNVDYLDFRGNFSYLYEVFFAPSGLGHIRASWFGNLALYLLFVSLFFVLIGKIKLTKKFLNYLYFLPIIGVGLHHLLTFTSELGSRVVGGDPNYFLIPIVISIILFFSIIFVHLKEFVIKKYVFFILILFFVFQMFLTFLTHPSYQVGTGRFNFDLTKSFIESDVRNSGMLKYNGLSEIDSYISSGKSFSRVLFFPSDDVKDPVFFRLPCRIESVIHAVSRAQKKLRSTEGFLNYLIWAKIDYLIFPKDYSSKGVKYIDNEESIFVFLMDHDDVLRVDSDKFYLFDISNVRKDLILDYFD